MIANGVDDMGNLVEVDASTLVDALPTCYGACERCREQYDVPPCALEVDIGQVA